MSDNYEKFRPTSIWLQRATEAQKDAASAVHAAGIVASRLRELRDRKEVKDGDKHDWETAWTALTTALAEVAPHVERVKGGFRQRDDIGDNELLRFVKENKIGKVRGHRNYEGEARDFYNRPYDDTVYGMKNEVRR